MSLHQLAQHMAAQGRGPDNMLVHMAPDEVAKLQSIARARGGSLTINPETGLVEAGFLSDTWDGITGGVSDIWSGAKGAVADVTSSPLGSLLTGAALAAMGVPPNMIPYIVGGAATVATGDLGKGLMAGLGAYGGSEAAAGLGVGEAGAVAGSGAGAGTSTLAPVSDAGTALQGAGSSAATSTGTGLSTLPSSVTPAQAAFNPIAADQAVAAAMPQTATALPTASIGDKIAGYGDKAYKWAGANPGKVALASASLGASAGAKAAAPPKGVDAPELPPGYIRPFVYDPHTHGLRSLAPVKAPGYAFGGFMGKLTNNITSAAERAFEKMEAPKVTSENAAQFLNRTPGVTLRAPLAPASTFSSQNAEDLLSGKASTASAAATPTQPRLYIPNVDTKVVTAKKSATDPEVPGYYVRDASGNLTYKESVVPTPPPPPPVEVEPPTPINVDAGANGGLMGEGYAAGGLGSLGGFSDGGRLLKGPGDGVSDSIPATIGEGQQPARLADGEFVIPARIVSELGNGSTDAGARQLYKMMDRIQAARSKTTGKNKVAANTRAAKHLPA